MCIIHTLYYIHSIYNVLNFIIFGKQTNLEIQVPGSTYLDLNWACVGTLQYMLGSTQLCSSFFQVEFGLALPTQTIQLRPIQLRLGLSQRAERRILFRGGPKKNGTLNKITKFNFKIYNNQMIEVVLGVQLKSLIIVSLKK